MRQSSRAGIRPSRQDVSSVYFSRSSHYTEIALSQVFSPAFQLHTVILVGDEEMGLAAQLKSSMATCCPCSRLHPSFSHIHCIKVCNKTVCNKSWEEPQERCCCASVLPVPCYNTSPKPMIYYSVYMYIYFPPLSQPAVFTEAKLPTQRCALCHVTHTCRSMSY